MHQPATRPWIGMGVALAAAGAIAVTPVAPPLPEVQVASIQLAAADAADMTLDFIRHGQSLDNVSGVMGTTPPGVALTDLGRDQAVAVGNALYNSGSIAGIDNVYASEFLRAQQTAWPLLNLFAGGNPQPGDIPGVLALPLVDPDHLLSGLNEINAGILDGLNLGRFGQILYVVAPLMWTLGLQFVPQWGSTIDPNGMAFDARFTDAIDTIYANDPGGTDAAFAHAASIMIWTQMNVKNPNPLLIVTSPLDNTGEVQVVGNPIDGWTLTEWNGIAIDPTPTLVQDLFVNTRDLITAPQTAAWNMWEGLLSGDPQVFLQSVLDGVTDVAKTTLNYPVVMLTDIIGAITGNVPLGLGAGLLPAAGVDVLGAMSADLGGLLPDAAGMAGLVPAELGTFFADFVTMLF